MCMVQVLWLILKASVPKYILYNRHLLSESVFLFLPFGNHEKSHHSLCSYCSVYRTRDPQQPPLHPSEVDKGARPLDRYSHSHESQSRGSLQVFPPKQRYARPQLQTFIRSCGVRWEKVQWQVTGDLTNWGFKNWLFCRQHSLAHLAGPGLFLLFCTTVLGILGFSFSCSVPHSQDGY